METKPKFVPEFVENAYVMALDRYKTQIVPAKAALQAFLENPTEESKAKDLYTTISNIDWGDIPHPLEVLKQNTAKGLADFTNFLRNRGFFQKFDGNLPDTLSEEETRSKGSFTAGRDPGELISIFSCLQYNQPMWHPHVASGLVSVSDYLDWIGGGYLMFRQDFGSVYIEVMTEVTKSMSKVGFEKEDQPYILTGDIHYLTLWELIKSIGDEK